MRDRSSARATAATLAESSTPTETSGTPAERLAAAEVAAHAAASHIRPAKPTDSDPDADELLHRAKNPRTPQPRSLTSYQRRDVRNAIATMRGW